MRRTAVVGADAEGWDWAVKAGRGREKERMRSIDARVRPWVDGGAGVGATARGATAR